jgi:hypothetical protein
MEPDGYTRWDRLPLLYPRLHEGVRGVDPADCLLRCVARTEPYELAARAIANYGDAHPATQRALAGLADDYQARCEVWARRTATPVRLTPGLCLVVVGCGLVGPLALASLVATDARLTSLRWWPAALMVAPLVVPLGWVALGTLGRLAAPRLGLGQALRERRCPDCAWHLASTSPAIAPALVEMANVGPIACPRCKRPWPLVPPPLDAALTGRIAAV